MAIDPELREYLDQRFDGVDQRLEGVDQRFDAVDRDLHVLKVTVGGIKTETGALIDSVADLNRRVERLER